MPVITDNNNYFKALSVLFTAFLAGQIIFALLAWYLVSSGSFHIDMADLENIFFILVPVFVIAGRLTGNMLYKRKIQEAQNISTTAARLDAYRAAFILRCALLEGPIIFAIIAFMLTGVMEMLAFVVGGIFLFYLLKPRKEKIAAEIQVSPEEIS